MNDPRGLNIAGLLASRAPIRRHKDDARQHPLRRNYRPQLHSGKAKVNGVRP